MTDKSIATDPRGAAGTGAAELPAWFPSWAKKLAELYFSGTTSMFVVGGNTFDYVMLADLPQRRYGTLAEFVAEQLFGRWDLVLHYDLARGLRCLAGRSDERLKTMVALANRKVGDLSAIPKDPTATLAVLDRFVTRNVMADDKDRLSVALVVDQASYVVPRGDRLTPATSTHLVTLINWAASPYVKRHNLAFLLIDPRLSEVAERLTANLHVATLDVPLPDDEERRAFLETMVGDREVASFSDYGVPEIAKLTAGISLTDLDTLVKSSIEAKRRLDSVRFRELKKRLIERQAQDLLEFIEPKWTLDMVVGHEAAKKRLKDDALLIQRGALDCAPMGYLFCGPVGTGKSFLAQCAAGSIGMPCVMLKNFRSKYVGETEANLERVLGVLRSMGPVMVIVDEADAMLGDRQTGGDSGVGSRVFGMIAAQMGDSRYRGRIVWVLMTARPDLLPIDLKRQGRAEVHIPLFYPYDPAEIRTFFVNVAKKLDAKLAADDVPEIPHKGHLSGADIEGLVGRAWRQALLAGKDHISRDILTEVVAGFMPSTQSLERELQELAAIIECTDREFLTPLAVKKMEDCGGREKLQERLTAIKRVLESQ
ncbi:MAG: ATP-binding protein [Deltaproteobacteria bacterium]|nr:ATP-binding protein [Deltaproteobacteria bacterium]